jgi:hypothetical protein
MPVDESLRKTLADVRNAYRIIWLYQRRLFDMTELIAKHLDRKFFAWSPVELARPCQRLNNPAKKRGWNLLPSYKFSLLYTLDGAPEPKPGDWMLEINFAADSGFRNNPHQDPDPTHFMAADACESTVALYGWACTKEGKRDWYNDVWDSALSWLDEAAEVADHAEEGIKVARKRCPLAALPNKEAVQAAVEDFKMLARHHFGPTFRI